MNYNINQSPKVDKVGVEERVARFQTRSIKNEAKIQGLKMTLNMIDLTTLEGKDTPGKVRQMCYKAKHLHDEFPGLPTVAAVCVYPTFVAEANAAGSCRRSRCRAACGRAASCSSRSR